MLNLSVSSLNGNLNSKHTVNPSEAPSNTTSTSSPYLQFFIIAKLCGMIIFSFLTMPTTIMLYLLPLTYSIIQLTRNPANPYNTVGVYSKSLNFSFPSFYLLLSTCMMSAFFVSLFMILSGFFISTMIVNP